MAGPRPETDIDQLWDQFHGLVNMSSAELRDWLAAVPELPGQPREEPESDLPSLGWEVVRVLGKRRGDTTDEDRLLMRTVIDIVNARLASPPPDGAADNDWRGGLMCLGHDPLRVA